jgi:hypothetical protein
MMMERAVRVLLDDEAWGDGWKVEREAEDSKTTESRGSIGGRSDRGVETALPFPLQSQECDAEERDSTSLRGRTRRMVDGPEGAVNFNGREEAGLVDGETGLGWDLGSDTMDLGFCESRDGFGADRRRRGEMTTSVSCERRRVEEDEGSSLSTFGQSRHERYQSAWDTASFVVVGELIPSHLSSARPRRSHPNPVAGLLTSPLKELQT